MFLLGMLSTQLFAQEHFYYYKGEKVALELNTDYFFLSAPQQNSIDNASINTIIDKNNSTPSEQDNTAQKLLKPQNFQAKTPVRFWREVKLASSHSRADYLAQMQATRKVNPEVIVAPYFKTKHTDKIGLSNFFYVKLKDKADYDLLVDQIKKHDAELVGYNKFMPLWYTVSASPQSSDALQLANLFYETGLFAAAEPDLMMDILPNDAQGVNGIELVPNDPDYTEQWCLNNTGQNGGIAGIDINAEAAWDITLGDNVRVAVLDHGFEDDHPDLDDNIVDPGYDTETGTSPSDIWGSHGIQCAGIIGAEGNNNEGISGVAPNTGLISISNRLVLSPTVTQDLADGINWAWDDGAADIISNSWGHDDLTSTFIDDAITNALTNGRGGLGTIVVFSSGNGNVDGAAYPGNSNPLILCIGANDRCGVRSGRLSVVPDSCDPWCAFCSPGSNYGSPLDVMAGGTSINTTFTGGTYTNGFGGTSAACPYVAGVAALVLSVNPNLTVQEVNDIIELSAQKVRTDLYTYSTTTGRPNGDWNNEMGYGLVDAYEAVLLAQASVDCSVDVVTNGGFEAGDVDFNSSLPANCACVSRSYCVAMNARDKCTNRYWQSITASEGDYYMVVDGMNTTIWSQDVSVKQGFDYDFSFDYFPNVSGGGLPGLTVELRDASTQAVLTTLLSNVNGVSGTWTNIAAPVWNAPFTGNVTLVIRQTQTAYFGDYGIDNIQFLEDCGDCSEELSVNTGTLAFEPEGGTLTFDLFSSSAWTISHVNTTWFSVTPTSGIGTTNISLTLDPNETTATRLGALILENACGDYLEVWFWQSACTNVVNGGFEDGDTGFSSELNMNCNCISSSYCVAENARDKCNNKYWQNITASEGDYYMVVDGATNKIVWSQTLSVQSGEQYYFSFDYFPNISGGGLPTLSVTAIQNGTTTTLINATQGVSGTWTTISAPAWTPAFTNSVELRITQTQSAYFGDYGIDNIVFTDCVDSGAKVSGLGSNKTERSAIATNLATKTIKLFPNPTTDVLNIETNSFEGTSIQVVDLMGKVLLEKTLDSEREQINLQDYPSGIYLVKWQDSEGMITTKKVIR